MPSRSPATHGPACTLRLPFPPTLRLQYPGEFLGLLARDHLALFQRMAAPGDVTPLRLRRERLVLLSHPEEIKPLVVTDRRSFAKGRALDQVKTLLGDGLLTSWMEGVLVLATIAQRQRLVHDPAHVVAREPFVTLRPKYGMRMRIERR